jgi:hypothetical protein
MKEPGLGLLIIGLISLVLPLLTPMSITFS